MQKNDGANQSQKVKEDFTAIWVMGSFARAMRMDLRYLQYFGKDELQLVEFIVQYVIKHIRFHLNYASMVHACVFRLSDSLQRWYTNTFVRKGFDTIIVTRKIMIDAKLTNAIENENVKQVIFLGAGYDSRALVCASKYKMVNFFELDRGFNREQKIAALKSLPKDLMGEIDVSYKSDNTYVFNQNLTCIDCDFTKDNLIELLCRHGFDLSLKTLVVAEGLSLYLPMSALNILLQSLHGLLTDDSEIIISFVGRKEMSQKKRAKIRARITVNGEMTYFALWPEHVMEYVNYHGFKIKDKFTTASSMALETNDRIKKYYDDSKRRNTAYYTLIKSSKKSALKSLNEVPEIVLDLKNKTIFYRTTSE